MKDERTTYIFTREEKAGGGQIHGQWDEGKPGPRGGSCRWEVDPRFDLRNHSPDGFNWGYEGSGPAQAALAVLADFAGDEIAREHYQDFKREFVARHDQDHWTLSGSEIRRWLFEDLGLDPFGDLRCPRGSKCDDPDCALGTLMGQAAEVSRLLAPTVVRLGGVSKLNHGSVLLGALLTGLVGMHALRQSTLLFEEMKRRLPSWLIADDLDHLADLGEIYVEHVLNPMHAKAAQKEAEDEGAVEN